MKLGQCVPREVVDAAVDVYESHRMFSSRSTGRTSPNGIAAVVDFAQSRCSIDLTQLPAYIELQKRLALAEAERDAALYQDECSRASRDLWCERADKAEAKLEAVRKWSVKHGHAKAFVWDELRAILDDQ